MAFAALTMLQIMLGIDSVALFLFLVEKLPEDQHAKAQTVGLGLAMLVRIGLLFSVSWVMPLTAPLCRLPAQEICGRDLIFSCGGLFLLAKATHEIH